VAAISAAAISGRNDSAANNRPIALFIGLDGLRPRFSSQGQSHAKTGDRTTIKNEPRKVSEPAVCGTSTTARKQATALTAASASTRLRARPPAPRSLARRASTISTGLAAITYSDQGRVPLASLTSEGNMSLVSKRSVKVSHEP